MDNLWWLVIGMMVVTYLPRLLPIAFLKSMNLPSGVKAFLEQIPYAALGALIFPGIISSTGDTGSAVGGAIAAIIAAWLKLNLLLVLTISVVTVYLIKLI
ncbi:MAG: AzlD domain-containing protein [Methanomassiliicoccales archaeon]